MNKSILSLLIVFIACLFSPMVIAQQFTFVPPTEDYDIVVDKTKIVNKQSSNNIDPQNIISGSTPEDFINFMNSAPDPTFAGDASYSITLLNVEAGGGLDFPLVLTYNSGRVRANMRPGIVGLGWDLNIGEVSRSFNVYPDEQSPGIFDDDIDSDPNDGQFNLQSSESSGKSEKSGILYFGDDTDVNFPGPRDDWDIYNLSTPYANSRLVPIIPDGGVENYFIERPYKNWIITYEKDNVTDFFSEFNMTDELGRKFTFDHPHNLTIDRNGNGKLDNQADKWGSSDFIFYKFPISWKLTGISSPTSDNYVNITYNNYAHSDYGKQPNNEFWKNNDVHIGSQSIFELRSGNVATVSYDESVVENIETRTHNIEFQYYNIGSDPARKALTQIRVISKESNVPQKIITFGYQTIDQPTHSYDGSLFHNYDDIFTLRNLSFQTVEYLVGNAYETYFDKKLYRFEYYEEDSIVIDRYNFVGKQNLLKKIILPTGGSIKYEYEDRYFSYWLEFEGLGFDHLNQKYNPSPSGDFHLIGTRLKNMILSGKNGEGPDIIKSYYYGEGIRINNSKKEVSYNSSNPDLILPMTVLSGTVGHRWVEIIDSDGGFTKNYFLNSLSNSTAHPKICNRSLSNCNGITENEALSVSFQVNSYAGHSEYLGLQNRSLYHNYNEAYGTVYKTETGYYQNGNPIINQTQIYDWALLESHYFYPQNKPSGGARDVWDSERTFMFVKHRESIETDGKKVTKLYSHFTKKRSCPQICRNVFWDSIWTNDRHGILTPPRFEITFDPDLNEPLIKENVYLGDIYENALTEPYNMIATKIGEFLIKDLDDYTPGNVGNGLYENIMDMYANGGPRKLDDNPTTFNAFDDLGFSVSTSNLRRESGYISYWDEADGEYRMRESWALKESNAPYMINSSISNAPMCNSGSCFNFPYDHNGVKTQSLHYNLFGDLIEVYDTFNKPTSIIRTPIIGTPIGVFDNANINNVFTHSFGLSGLQDWEIIDFDNADSEFSIRDNKLYLRNEVNASNTEFDAIRYYFEKDLTEDFVVEFDIKIAETNNWDLIIGLGNSSWYGRNDNYRGPWSAINNENWKVYDNENWHTIKSGLEVGKTYAFKIVIKPNSHTADYYVDGELGYSNAEFVNNNSIAMFGFSFYGNNSTNSEWYIDNFRVYPESASAKTQEIDKLLMKPVSLKVHDGTSARFTYFNDGTLRSVSNNNNLLSSNDYGYSIARSNLFLVNDGIWDTYQANDPNYLEAISYEEQYFASKFIDSEGFTISGDAIFNFNAAEDPPYFLDNHVLKLANTSSVSKSIGQQNLFAKIDINNWSETGSTAFSFTGDGNHFGVKIYPVPDPNAHFYGKVIIEYQKAGYSLQTIDLPIHSINMLWYTIELEKNGENLTAWVYPITQGRHEENKYTVAGFNSSWAPDITISSTLVQDAVFADNLFVGKLGTISRKYYDGLGRQIQEQSISDGESITTGIVYDDKGLQVVESLPISDLSDAGYLTTLFGSDFIPGGAIPENSAIVQYYDLHADTGEEEYAYFLTEYEKSRTSRPISSTLPGYDYRQGSGNESTITNTINTVEVSTPNKSWPTGSLAKIITIDQDDNQTITYKNYLGQTVASGVDWDSNGELNGTDDLVTTFEYDYNGNLILVEDPRGLQTTYIYNAIGELLEKKLPDQDHSNKYCYDDKGRLRFHADPNDFANPYNYYQLHYSYTYTKYDEFDRPVEIGAQDASFVGNNSQASFEIICANSIEINDQNEPSANNNPMIIYSYDGVNAASGTRNHKGRLSRTQYKDPNTGSWGYTWYSYNELGLVEMIKQQMPGHNYYNDRTISYTYDELGRLVHVAYDEGYSSTGDHHFWYYYDGFGRLSKITSHQTNSPSSATKEAEYTYYADGHVEQLILGDGVQTIDYDYTIQGWLDDINNGLGGSGDVFSTNLEYDMSGNIVKNTWYQKGWYTSGLFPAYNYEYDNANRLKNACYGSSLSTACPETSMSGFDVAYDYDNSGNLTRISRLDDAAHEMEYTNELESGTNKIDYVSVDGISGATQPQTKQFTYDANGNVIENELQGITDITYDWRNLPTKVIANGTTIKYTYDAEGNRVKKEVVGGETTYYIRGVDGQAFAAYSGYTIKFLNILAGGEIIGQIIKN